MTERTAGVRRGARVLHSSRHKIIHHGLRVLLPGIVNPQLSGEEIDHRRSAIVVDGKAIAFAVGRIVGDRLAAPGVFHLVKFARDKRDQIRRAGQGFTPIPNFLPASRILDADQPSVRHRDPVRGHRDDHLRRQTVVRIVISGQVIARVFGFTLRPDLLGPVWIGLVRKDKIEALFRLAFIADLDLQSFSSPCGGREIHKQLVRGRLELGGLSVNGDALNGEADRIEGELRSAVVQDRERVGDVAEDLALFQVEPKGDLRVLEVVVTAASIGLVGAGKARGEQKEKKPCR